MAGEVKLSSAIRANLLSLQATASLVARTQGRLSTGLKVASAIDDAVAFFQAKSLTDRANDLTGKKNGIDQGISSLTTALQAVESTEDVFSQMKGLVLSAKSGTASDRLTLSSQFNNLAQQANNLIGDSSYQGLNLVNSTANALKVSFSEKTSSVLNVDGANILVTNFVGLSFVAVSTLASAGFTVLSNGWSAVGNSISLFDAVVDILDSAITTIRTNAATLGSNVSLLQTRLDFTTSYVNTLTGGSDKLTLADLNEEGANLVALQTHQQLATQALAFAGQAERAVLQLFT
ncbi:MAG: flagellin [Rhodospirillales bacterium]|jgi:flagellin-like hook-associated protein FlgL|nr:flagellin [Rhodospirillales bacterium]